MKVTIEIYTLTSYYLTWLMLYTQKGKWLQPEDILMPLIGREWARLNPLMPDSTVQEGGGD